MEPRLTLSVLCLNRLELTQRCVKSILQHTTVPFELRLWDNGSTDSTSEYCKQLVREHSETVYATHVPRNVGFIRAHNQQTHAAVGEYVGILNNDIEVGAGWAEQLIAPMNADPYVGATGPRDYYGYLGDDFNGVPGDIWKPVEYISGHCLFTRKAIIDRLGLFDEVHLRWAYGEDADFSLRIRQAGYGIKVVDGVPVSHIGRATTDHVPHDLLGYDPAEAAQHNHAVLVQRWRKYLATRTF